MNKHMRTRCIFCLVISMLFVRCQQRFEVEQINELNHYSSGSALAFFNKHVYIMGDDMNYLLMADTVFNPIDTISIIKSTQNRIPKSIKHDIEAATVVSINKKPALLFIGSGSANPHRNKGWLIDAVSKQKFSIDLDTFYQRIKAQGINDLNIEGITAVQGGMVLANRGNKNSAKNYLIFTTPEFWNRQPTAELRIIKLGANTDTLSFSGVSGLEYSTQSDMLLLTVSTEDTRSSTVDGAIGKSYLWIINNISSKKRLTAINPNRIIDLEEMDARFKGHKIESVCILKENRKIMQLALVADDDKGTTVLFKVSINKSK